MKIVFAGTPEFSVPALDALIAAGHVILAVYTQPDRPAGRGRKLRESPVKRRAMDLGIPVRQPETLKNETESAALCELDADIMVVVAYGLILPKAILETPRLGCINIHASLLPRWRGAAPISRAIMAGDDMTGISIMQMDEGLDTGPVLLQKNISIESDDTADSLHDRLALLGGDVLIEAMSELAEADEQGLQHDANRQDDSLACYADKLCKAEAVLDWSQPATDLERAVRAMNPWPVAETRWRGKQLRVWRASAVDMPSTQNPGFVDQADDTGIRVVCGSGALMLKTVQLAGRKATTAADFVNANNIAGSQLGDADDTGNTRGA